MKRPSRDESDATIDLGKPPARHAKGARPKPEPRHALVRQPAAPRPRRSRPEHASVRLHLPSFHGREVRPRHLLIGAALLGAGVASVAGAGAAAHRVDAATPPGPAAPTAMALSDPGRLPTGSVPPTLHSILPSTGIHSTRPVAVQLPRHQGAPAVVNSRAGAVAPPARRASGRQTTWWWTSSSSVPAPPASSPARPSSPAEPSTPTRPAGPPSSPSTGPPDPSSPPSDPSAPPSSSPPSIPSSPPSSPAGGPTDPPSDPPSSSGSNPQPSGDPTVSPAR